jgi:hypothetical protein
MSPHGRKHRNMDIEKPMKKRRVTAKDLFTKKYLANLSKQTGVKRFSKEMLENMFVMVTSYMERWIETYIKTAEKN